MWRSDKLAWAFGTLSGTGAGLAFALLTLPAVRLRVGSALPGTLLEIDAIDWLFLSLVLSALLLFPALTIGLARRRTFGWPLLPLTAFFVCMTVGSIHSLGQAFSSLELILMGLGMFSLLAWVPFSRTVLFSGNRTLRDDKSCGPRALYLACREMGMRVTIHQVRRLTKITAKGTTTRDLERAAVALGLSVTRVPLESLTPNLLPAEYPVMPALAVVAWGAEHHAVAVFAIQNNKVRLHDPNRAWESIISLDRLREASRFDLLTLSRRDASAADAPGSVWPPPPRSGSPELV